MCNAQVVRCVSDVTKEVNRVMAEPEINGNPVALNFSKGDSTAGYSREFVKSYDRIFAKNKSTVDENGPPTLPQSDV